MAPQPSLPVNIFLNAIMIKIWAVIIINSTHFKATDCYLAYSLGGEKTNNRGNTSILCHSVPHHTSQRNPFIDKGLPYGEEQKMQEAILYPGRAWCITWLHFDFFIFFVSANRSLFILCAAFLRHIGSFMGVKTRLYLWSVPSVTNSTRPPGGRWPNQPSKWTCKWLPPPSLWLLLKVENGLQNT